MSDRAEHPEQSGLNGRDPIPQLVVFNGAADDFGLSPRPRARLQLIDPLLNADLGGVRIIRLIGEGGMGRVYEAWQERPGRSVAVKVIRQGLTSEQTMRRFDREMEFLGRLQHPAIAQIFIVGTYASDFGEIPFYVMEHIVAAKPVVNYVHEHNVSMVDRVVLFQRVCEAVAHGHDRGIVHRDLKPGNILIDGEGRPKVIDFGVARSTNSDLAMISAHTSTGQLVGTVQYMSPEQFGAEADDLDARVDVYALGLVLYEMVAGDIPYEVRGKPLHEASRIVCEQVPAPLRHRDRSVPRELSAIVDRCLRKNRSDRYHSAGALAADIGRFLEGRPLARPERRWPTALLCATLVLVLAGGALNAVLWSIDADRNNVAASPVDPLRQDDDENRPPIEDIVPPIVRELKAAHDGLTQGLLMLEYPRLEIQDTVDDARVSYTEFPKPLGDAAVVREMSPWRYTATRNAVAFGYIRVEQAGTYGFNAHSFYARKALYVDGHEVSRYRDDRKDAVFRLHLDAGLVPIVVVGYVDARGEVTVRWMPPGDRELSAIPPELLVHNPGSLDRFTQIDPAEWPVKLETNLAGITLLQIPTGKFQMGEGDGAVAVTLPRPFWLGKTEVTQSQWEKVMGTKPWPAEPVDANLPASHVNWEEVREFCEKLTARERSSGKLQASEVYRLPTEAEWEYACRAGTTTTFSFGDDESKLGDFAWFTGNSENKGHPVGTKQPNLWGLHDMPGNVWEWCSDWHDGRLAGGVDPVGPAEGSKRVLRGGSWENGPRNSRSADRYNHPASSRSYAIGFRVARSQSGK